MEKSQSIGAIAKALISFHTKVDKVKKDASNPFFKSKYASLSNILEAIHTPLLESGLTFSQFPSNGHSLTTIIIHAESGEYMLDTYEMKPVKDDPQGRGSCITYQRRYALAAVLGLNIDEDDDANLASTPKAEVKKGDLALTKKGKISDKAFSEAKARIEKGEAGLYDKLKEMFSLSVYQDEQLSDASKRLNGKVHA